MRMIENLESRQLYSVSTTSASEPLEVAPAPTTVEASNTSPSPSTTLASMKHEATKSIVQNLRG